jgi:hypothetical protein
MKLRNRLERIEHPVVFYMKQYGVFHEAIFPFPRIHPVVVKMQQWKNCLKPERPLATSDIPIYPFDHQSQATLSSDNTWMGDHLNDKYTSCC